MDILVTGSVAYDYLMTFPGLFKEQILPERLASISLSFLVDSMSKQRGGIAPNIAYTMALLGGKPRVMATVGEDFSDYRSWLEFKRCGYFADESHSRGIHCYIFCDHRSSFLSNCLILSRGDGILTTQSIKDLRSKTRSGRCLTQCTGCDDEVPCRMP